MKAKWNVAHLLSLIKLIRMFVILFLQFPNELKDSRISNIRKVATLKLRVMEWKS